MDKEQAAVTAALEDYRTRCSELVSLTVEINRWRSLIPAMNGRPARHRDVHALHLSQRMIARAIFARGSCL